MQHPLNHIFEHTPETLAAWCQQHGMPKFRATQILEWVYQRGVVDPALMTNLSKGDRDTLAQHMTFLSGDVIRHQVATDGTQKLLVQWREPALPPGAAAPGTGQEGGALVSLPIASQPDLALDPTRQTECVMIPAEDRRTACISSQVGCPVGCRFCASGLGGLDSNLSAGRIVEQVWMLRKMMQGTLPGTVPMQGAGAAADGTPATPSTPPAEFPRITNVVFMGMGEPLANLAGVIPAVRIITSLSGMAISARKVTISTVGLHKAIEKLAEQLDLPVTLALSLHAPTDEIRRSLIPWAEYTSIEQLLQACRAWFERTGREITLEYTLLRGVNDRPEHAEALATIARSLRGSVNLIRYNEVQGLDFQRPRDEDVRAFQEVLRRRSVNVHIRASRGRDIAAACGQLRHETGTKQRRREAEREGDATHAPGAAS